MTVLIREESPWGKDGSATMFFTGRWGSAVIRQMLSEGDELREWGMLIFPGFRRFLSTTCFLVVNTSQTASWLTGPSSASDSSSSPMRVFLVEDCSFSCCFELMCRRSAEEAFWTCDAVSSRLPRQEMRTNLRIVKLVRRSRSHLRGDSSRGPHFGRHKCKIKWSILDNFCDRIKKIRGRRWQFVRLGMV